MMKNSLFLIIFVAIVYAQFDHVFDQGATLNLVQTATGPNGGLHTEFSASATGQYVIGGQCRETVHSVTNVQLNNGPLNSGTYFTLTITHSANATLLVTLGTVDREYFDILQVAGTGASVSSTADSFGLCAPSSGSCVFRYYCDIYPSETPLQVEVDTLCNPDSSNAINFYDVSVTQYVETIQIIPASRSLAQSNAVVDPFTTGNLGPANFIHYYHDLNPTVAEAGASSRLYIEATGFSNGGTAYICISYNRMVASTSSLSQVTPFTGNLDLDPVQVTAVNEPTGCSIICAAATISVGGTVSLGVDACNNGCGFKETIWIGVAPPGSNIASTYTVRLRFRDFSVPDLITLNTSPALSDGALILNCNGKEGNFACDEYYEITYASVGSPTIADSRVGPFLAVELFGVYNGEAKLEVADGFLAGLTSKCPGCTPLKTCTVCDDPVVHPICTHTDCWAVIQPCQWNSNLSNDWVFTVSAVGQDDPNIPIEYGVRASIGSWPLTTVTPTAWETGQPNFGNVLVDHYNHYQVTFTDAQIFDDSYFQVELYTNYDDDVVAFAWNFNKLADDGTCYGSSGLCKTNTNCNEGTINLGSCRFVFFKCPISVSYNDYFKGAQLPGQVSGDKVSELKAGTYYFAVWGVQPGSLSYSNSIHYTIYWNYHGAIQIFDQVNYHDYLHYLDYSPQYKLVIPADDDISNIRVRIGNTQTSGVTAYIKCGELAGDCPCFTFDDVCLTDSYTGGYRYDCNLNLSPCDCTSGVAYVSVWADISDTNTNEDITYTLTAYFDRLEFPDIDNRVYSIQASRAISPIIDTIRYAIYFTDFQFYTNLKSYVRFYKVSFVNTDLSDEDALMVTLGITQTENYADDSLYYGYGYYDFISVGMIVSKNSYSCNSMDNCLTRTSPYSPVSPVSGGDDSFCTLTFQPCFNDNPCVDSDCSMVGSTDISFDHDSEYFIGLFNLGSLYSIIYGGTSIDNYYVETVQYTLNVQVRDQSPYILQDGVPFFGDVERQNYVHFSYDVSSVPANNRLVFTMYGDHDQQYPLSFFVNYNAKAGMSRDCYGTYFNCYSCTLYNTDPFTGDEIDHCYFEITPCELSQQSGTYYLSVYGLHQPNNDEALFTVMAQLWPTVALLDSTGFGVPTPGNLMTLSSQFYSVTVPELVSGNIVGRVLSIDVEAVIKGQIYVSITKIMPDNQCDCAKDDHLVLSNRDDINWKRYSCELQSNEVYYISVKGDQTTYCDPTGFVVHAKLQNIINIPITLTSVDSRIIGSYDNSLATPATGSNLTLTYNQFTALSFTTNAPAGAVLDILITEADNIFGDLLPFEVRLSIGSVATPSGTNDGFNIGPDPDRSTCPFVYDSCVYNDNVNEECRLFVDACFVPEGTVTWFLTFSGELLPLNSVSDIISVSIRLIAPESIISTPAISSYGPVQTTGLIYSDTLDRSYGFSYYTTSSSMGINAGDSVTFSLGVSGSMYVRLDVETDVTSPCSFTCGDVGANPTCTVHACETITAGTWFIMTAASAGTTTGTFTITRTQGSNSTLNLASPSPIPINNPTSFTSLTAGQWRYHSYTVQSSTSSHYELTITGANANNIVYVSSPIFLPQFTINPITNVDEVTLFNDGSVSITCGGTTSVLPSATCCYDTITQTFAVVGPVSGYTLNVELVEFAGNSVQSVSVPSNTTGTATLGRVNWYSFTQPVGAHLWLDMEVFTGSAEFYLNVGSRAGSQATNFENGGDFGYCWNNDGLLSSNGFCGGNINAGTFCNGFIANCNSCLNDNNGYTFFVGVVPNPNATFAIQVISQTDRSLSTGQNNGLIYPVPSGSFLIDDITTATDAFSAYAHYTFVYDDTFFGLQNFIPARNDPAVQDLFDYANLEIYIDNFRDSTGTVTSNIPVRVYINYGNYAGSSSSSNCYGGREITTGGATLPCIESSGGAAFSNSTAIECSINVCDLGNCGGVIYLSTSRLTSGSNQAFTYDIEVIKDYNDVLNWVDIVNLNSASSFPFTYNGDDTTDVVYFRFSLPGISNFADATSQYLHLTFDQVSGENQSNTQIDITLFPGNICVPFSLVTPVCDSIGTDDVCRILTDPCGTGSRNVDKNIVDFIRVERVSSDVGRWSFVFDVDVLTVNPIDTQLTALAPVTDPSYSAIKEIIDFTWHFYEFFVSPTDGYSYLSVDIGEVCCLSGNKDLEIYYSWEQQSDSEVYDNARPNRWASASCNVRSTSTSTGSSSNDIDDLCQFWGGAYRIGIFAPIGYQLFPDPVLNVVYPALYSINVMVNTVNYIRIAPECTLSQVVGSSTFTSRLELYVPAENRGTDLSFILNMDRSSSGGDIVLWASRNSNPWHRTTGVCTWDETIVGDFNCSPNAGSNGCTINIPACDFEDGIWYLFIQRPGSLIPAGTTVSVSSRMFRKYIPVLDLTSVNIITTMGSVSNSYQFYKILIDRSDELSLLTVSISDNGCSSCNYALYALRGPQGIASDDTENLEGPSCVSNSQCTPDCYCWDYRELNDNILTLDTCSFASGINTVMIGVFASSNFCSYQLTAWAHPRRFEVLPFNVETCSLASCIEYWQISDSTGNTDLTGANVIINVKNADSRNLNVYINPSTVGETCARVSTICPALSLCTYELNCIQGSIYVGFGDGTSMCTTCSGIQYSIVTSSVFYQTFNAVTLGTSTATPASFTTGSAFVYAVNPIASYSIGTYSPNGCATDCLRVLDDNSSYFFNSGTVLLNSVNTINSLSTNGQSFTIANDQTYFHFSVTPPAGSDSFTLHFDNVNHCACDGNIANLDLYIRSSTVAPPFDGCFDCTGGNLLTAGACPSNMASLTYSCAVDSTYYFTISSCGFLTCDVTFTGYVEFSTPRTQIGGTHTTAFTPITTSTIDCPSLPVYSYYVEVTDILSVTLKEPHGDISGASVTILNADSFQACTSEDSCSVTNNVEGVSSSCRAGNCHIYSYSAPGTYYINVNYPLSGDSATVYLQVVNQWVDLSSSVSTMIIGQTRHFYRLSNALQAVSIDLTVTDGPSLTMIVFDDSVANYFSNIQSGFQETIQCSFGTCTVYLPTRGKHSLVDTFYIELDSANIFDGPTSPIGNSASYTRDMNENAEKPTHYTLSATLGTANCASPPSTGFCASDSEGGNVWSEINNSVWNYEHPDLKDNEAECRFNTLIQRCPNPSKECREWLKVFSCLESFPQCDGSGFQMGMCSDVCTQVTDACGNWVNMYLEYACCSDRYVEGSDSTISTCYNIPPPPPPPATFEPELGSDVSSVPPAFVVPVFSTIDVFLPDNFVRKEEVKGIAHQQSSANQLAALSILLLIVLSLF